MTKYDILKEINYMLDRANKMLIETDNAKDKENHLIALGEVMALTDIRYSLATGNYLFKGKEIKKRDKSK